MTVQAAAHAPGTLLRCGACGATLVCVGGELAAICTNGDRHRATQMRPVVEVESSERETA